MQGTSTSGTGVDGVSTAGIGVHGDSPLTGVAGTSTGGSGVAGVAANGTGVFGRSTGGIGGFFLGGQAPLFLGPGSVPGAPTTGMHLQGEIYLDSAATMWVCVVSDGSGVGTWARLASVANGTPGGALNFLSVPIRILDTRGNGAPFTNGNTPISGGGTLHVQVTGTAVGGVSVPAGALAVIGNLTALPFSAGDLTIYASGQPKPNVSNLNYNTGLNVANGVIVKLSGSGAVDIYSNVGSCNVILDITGYIA